LKGAALGVLGSFVSRNNDVDGYWGIGKLYSHALRTDAKTIAIDLVGRTITPPSDEFRSMVSRYSEAFLGQCRKRSIPCAWANTVDIRISFNVTPEGMLLPPRYTAGELFDCVIEVTDDLGRAYVGQVLGWCKPHNPAREAKSARV